MPKLKIETTDPGMAKVLADFNKLNASQKKLVVAQSTIGKKFEESGRKARKNLGRTDKLMGSITARFTAANIIAGIWSKTIEGVRREFERIKGLEDEAAGAQEKFQRALGKSFANIQGITAEEEKRIKLLATEEGKRFVGAAFAVARAVPQAISGTGIDIKTEFGRLERAITGATRLSALDRDIDIGRTAIAFIKTVQALESAAAKRGEKLAPAELQAQAEALVSRTGQEFAGDFSNALKVLPQVLAAENLGVRPADALALFAELTNKIGDDTGDQVKTLVTNILSRFAGTQFAFRGDPSSPFRGQVVDIKGESAFEKFLNLLERIDAGEFGKTRELKAQAVLAITERGAGKAALLGLAADLKGFERARKRFAEAKPGADPIGDRERAARRDKQQREIIQLEEKRARFEVSQILDERRGQIARIRERREISEKEFDLPGTFLESLRQFFADFFLPRIGVSPETLQKTEEKILLRRAIAPGARLDIVGVSPLPTSLLSIFEFLKREKLVQEFRRTGDAQAFAQEAINQGFVNIGDGINKTEAKLIELAGLQAETIKELKANKDATNALLRELVTAVTAEGLTSDEKRTKSIKIMEESRRKVAIDSGEAE